MQILYGLHPVLESLRSGSENIEYLLIALDKKGDPVEEILLLAGQRGIPVRREKRDSLGRLVPGKPHQGVLAWCGEFPYASLEDIVGDTPADDHLLLILDSIIDPHNLGSLIRSAHCFGARGVVIPKDRAAAVTPAVIRVSAGSARHTPVCRVVNIVRALEFLKNAGYWIYGAGAEGTAPCTDIDYRGPTALVMGSEGSGLRPLVRRHCDRIVRIPMTGAIDSLNVAVAGGILLYEATRERNRKNPAGTETGT